MHQVTDSYTKLADLVESGVVKIYYELSLPRSNSTAWQIAICEADEIAGQINEPSFHEDFKSRRFAYKTQMGDRTFQDWCNRVLKRLEGSVKENKNGLLQTTQKRPVGLVINDLSHSINRDELLKILRLTKHIIITIRDPRIQALSALTRIINDALDSPGGGSICSAFALNLANKIYFTENEIDAIIKEGKINPTWILKSLSQPENSSLTPELLAIAIKQAISRCNEDYVEICWNNLIQQLDFINNYAKKGSVVLIIDGNDLTTNPEVIMRKSSEALGIIYNPNMVDNWSRANGKNFHCCITENWGELAFTNSWNGPVRASTKLEAKPNSTHLINIQDFPEIMRETLENALNFYQNIVRGKFKVLENSLNNPQSFFANAKSNDTMPKELPSCQYGKKIQ